MKKLAIISSVLALLLAIGCAFLLGKSGNRVEVNNLGAGFSAANYYYYGASSSSLALNTSSSITSTATTTLPILSRDDLRQNATVCHSAGTSTVWLHRMSQATTTGVLLGYGIPINPTSTPSLVKAKYPSCVDFPGFRGFLLGISESPASTTASVEK